jgi:hypothetical protein
MACQIVTTGTRTTRAIIDFIKRGLSKLHRTTPARGGFLLLAALNNRGPTTISNIKNAVCSLLSYHHRGSERQGLLMGFGNTRPESMQSAMQTPCCLIDG